MTKITGLCSVYTCVSLVIGEVQGIWYAGQVKSKMAGEGKSTPSMEGRNVREILCNFRGRSWVLLEDMLSCLGHGVDSDRHGPLAA